MARHPFVTAAALVAAQTRLGLGHGELWYIDEVRHAAVLRALLREGHWLVLHLDGEPYPDKPPVYFWLLAGLARLLGTDGPAVHAIAVALSAIAFACAAWWMARAVGGLGREGALAAMLVLLSTALCIERSQAPRMDLLFAAVITAACTWLFLAWTRPAPSRAAVAGLAAAGVATLVKGPLGLVFPLLSSAVFLIAQGRWRRLLRWDVVLGALVAVVLAGGWLLAAGLAVGESFLRRMVAEQLVARTVASPLQQEGWLYYGRVLPLAAMPWTAVWIAAAAGALAGVRRWRRETAEPGGGPAGPRGVLGTGRRVLAAVRAADAGVVFLATIVLVDLVVLSAMSYKLALYLLHVLTPLSVLAARLLLALDEGGVRRARRALALVFAALALALPWVPRFYPWPDALRGLGWAAGAFGALGIALWLLRESRAVPLVAAVALGVTVAIQPLVLITRPGLDAVMSPKALGEIVQRYARQGYVPVSYQIRDYRLGTLSYYAGQVVRDVEDPRALRALLDGPRPVVVLTLEWRLPGAPPALRRLTAVHRQRLDRDRWVVLVTEPR
jgi:4-amino-4-deoxy-L-arabinose transferase-like glycosyltransferase